MEPIYSGFDGLEFALKSNISFGLSEQLEAIKLKAQELNHAIEGNFNGVILLINTTGSSGGYTYACKEHESGDWFFKRPTAKDPWGVRFSASSSALAMRGIDGIRLRCAEVLEALGVDAPIEAYHPSRIDFAIDFLAPDLTIDAEHFVTHSRMGKKSVGLLDEMQINGRAHRTTSVTVGKMPGRQVIIYDKREEVLAKGKLEWPKIWGRSIRGPLAPPLDIADPKKSRVWRVELRVAKRHLKDVWDVNSWASLYELLPRILINLLDDVRYCSPSADCNRSRWPDHKVWKSTRHIVTNHLFDCTPHLTPDEYVEIKRSQKIDQLTTQVLGLTISLAAINGPSATTFTSYLNQLHAELEAKSRALGNSLQERLAKSRMKYRYLVD